MRRGQSFGLGMMAMMAVGGCQTPAASSLPVTAEQILTQSKAASGGSAWDTLQGCYEEGTRGDGVIAYRTWFSLLDYGMRVESEVEGVVQAMGFNGDVAWRTGPDGETQTTDNPAALQEAVLTAYLSNNGFFFPDRFPANAVYIRQDRHADRAYDVISITPEGGREFEAWFDRSTHLIGRVVDAQGAEPVIVEAEDYGEVDGLVIAFGLRVMAPDETLVDTGRVIAFQCGPVDNALFDPPVG